MKKFVFFSNKKIFILAMTVIGLMIIETLIGITMSDSDLLVDILSIAFKVFIAVAIINRFSFQATIQGDILVYGFIRRYQGHISDISQIKVNGNKFILVFGEHVQKTEVGIDVSLIENNSENAREFLYLLFAKSPNLKNNTDENVLKFLDSSKDYISDSTYTKITGSLLILCSVIVFYLIQDAAGAVIHSLLLVLDEYNVVRFISLIVFSVEALLGIVALILILTLKKSALGFIKYFRIYYIVSTVALSVINLITQMQLNKIGLDDYMGSFLDIIYAIFATIMIIEYLKTSKRANRTLVK